jgi:uncharacterized protein (TIGR02453 family)
LGGENIFFCLFAANFFIMAKINPETLQFLTVLKQNNQRDWFHEHKSDYEKAKNNFVDFASTLLENLQSFDQTLQNVEIKQCFFRIYRDVRFSPNKEPYKTHFGVYFAKNGGKNSDFAGYYFHLDPEESFFGGGIYMPLPEYLKIIRKEIYYQIDEFNAILNALSFKKYYPDGIEEIEKLKKAPTDFPKDFPDIELLKNKHFFTSYYYQPQDALKDDFINDVTNGFKAVKPLVDFINFTIDTNM